MVAADNPESVVSQTISFRAENHGIDLRLGLKWKLSLITVGANDRLQ